MSDPIKDAVGALLTTPTNSPVSESAEVADSTVDPPLEVTMTMDGRIQESGRNDENVERTESASEESGGVLKVCTLTVLFVCLADVSRSLSPLEAFRSMLTFTAVIYSYNINRRTLFSWTRTFFGTIHL